MRDHIIRLFYFLLLLIAYINLPAQGASIKFDGITTENGLPQEHIFCILQDNRGFLWLGTEIGLLRYDGYSYKTYQHSPADSTTLSSNIIKAIHQDNQSGDLWIGTDGGGLCRFDPKQEKFYTYQHEANNPNSLSGNRVYAICQEPNGTIWLGTLSSGLNRIVFDQGRKESQQYENPSITRFQHQPGIPTSLSDNHIWTMHLDREKRLWIGTTTGGLNRLDIQQSTSQQTIFYHYQDDSRSPNNLSGHSVRSIHEDKFGHIWVGTEYAGLNKIDMETGQTQVYQHAPGDLASLSHNYVSTILEDRDGRLWLGTNGGGINIFDRKEQRFIPYRKISGDPYSLNGDMVNVIYQDRSGIIWIGLVNKGLNWIDPQKQRIKHYYPLEEQPRSLKGNLIKTLYKDRSGEIWVGAYGNGLSSFDLENEAFTNYLYPEQYENSLASNNIQKILEDSRGQLWIGTDGGGLHLFDRQDRSFTAFNESPDQKSRLSGSSVWALCEDLRGNLWIGTADGGLNRYDWKTQSYLHFPSREVANSVNSNDIRVIYEDHLGIIWIGTYGGGLNRYNPTEDNFFHYKNDPADPGSISNNIITAIFESASGKQLWIGTFGGGLNHFDRISGTFQAYREKDGLPNDVVKSIEEDSEGNLWVSTLNGIAKFNPDNVTFVNYTSSDGLQGNSFNLGSSCKLDNGTLLFGGTNGFNLIYPDKLKRNDDPALSCLITDLKVLNRSIQPGEKLNKKTILENSISVAQKVTIPYTIYDFVFEFAALDFASPDKIEYAYKMEGVDEEWHYVDANRRYAPYANLDAGEYVFKLKATNRKGVWSSQATALAVSVLPPPWKTWWAYTIYLVLIVGLITLTRHYTIARLKLLNALKLERLERKKNREISELKMRFFTNISHEIRTPLTLILGPLEALMQSGVGGNQIRGQFQSMYRNAGRLLNLVNQLLEFRKQESGHTSLKVRPENLVSFINEIILSFKELAFQKKIRLTFRHQPEQIQLWFDHEQLENVFFNLLSNAFKFTPEGGTISVAVTETDAQLIIVVEDDGQGIPPEDLPYIFDRFYKFDKQYSGNYLGSGIGLALSKGIVELHKGSMNVQSEPGEFTRFTVSLKKGKDHFETHQIMEESAIKNKIPPFLPESATAIPLPAAELTSRQSPPKHAEEILLIEDNEEVRTYLRSLFAEHFSILEASDGQEGFDAAMLHGPDIIISDIMMPIMDGITLCRKLKTNIETSHIPVILLTANTSMPTRFEGFETGADDYVTKPFHPELLKKRVFNLIESRKKLRARFSQVVQIEPHNITLTSPDTELIRRATEIIEEHISDEEFDVNTFAREIGLSRSVLYRKIPALTNYTPNEFIRVMRLKRAAQLLVQNTLSVAEVCYSTGFKTPKYFSKCFKEEFGLTPTEYARRHFNS